MNFKTLLILTSLPVFLSGCLKPLTIKKEPLSFAPPTQRIINVPRKDNGAIYQEGMRVGLYSDLTARYVGDVITIELVEATKANSTSNTNSSKDNDVKLPGPTLAGDKVTKDGKEILANDLKGERKFKGEGTSAMSSSFDGKISVMVVKVLPNNNLVVRGEKMMLLNQSDEYLRFIGIVRPQDISQDNVVKSTSVADMQVAYGGQGVLSEANQMGPLSRFFQSQAWPY